MDTVYIHKIELVVLEREILITHNNWDDKGKGFQSLMIKRWDFNGTNVLS